MPGPSGPTADQRMALAREWDELLERVRGLPEFEDFLRPPNLAELLTAAVAGPVVVLNVSRWRSDALVVTTVGVRSVPLPEVTLEDAHERLSRHLGALATFEAKVAAREAADAVAAAGPSPADPSLVTLAAIAGREHRVASNECERELAQTCGWLWSAVVGPVVADLNLAEATEPPRVWWCPTGPLTLLPIHAAGHGDTWLADLAVSSYTPTVRALVDARRPRRHTPGPARFLVASALSGDPATSGLLSDVGNLDIVQRDTVAGVTAALPESRFVHFDCHADQDLQDPAQGGLELSDGVLRIFDLAALPLDGEYAALAACKTAVGGTNLLDESITLAAALHYTGFRHVIGSLWILSDRAAVTVFDSVYPELSRSGQFVPDRSAQALANATNALRQSGEQIHTWAALVHIGP